MEQIIVGDFSKMKATNQYVNLINAGKIIICHKIKQSLQKVNRYLNEYEYDQNEADKRIKWIENNCVVGEDYDKIKLNVNQKYLAEVIFGFFTTTKTKMIDPETQEEYFVDKKTRLIHQFAYVVARRNGKSMFGAQLVLAEFFVSNERNLTIDLVADTISQASITMKYMKTLIDIPNTGLYQMKEAKYLSVKKGGITLDLTSSNKYNTYNTIALESGNSKALDGKNNHMTIFDEVHSYTKDFMDTITMGSKGKRDNWIAGVITTNGTTRGSVFDKLYDKWTDILNETIIDDSYFPLIYELDDIKDVTGIKRLEDGSVNNYEKVKNFQKSNPLINVIPTLIDDVIIDEMTSSATDEVLAVEVLTKVFNIPENPVGVVFTNEEMTGNRELYDERYFTSGTNAKLTRAIIGCDFSLCDDFTSISLLTEYDHKKIFKSFIFTLRKELNNFSDEDKIFILDSAAKGDIILLNGSTIDAKEVIDTIYDYMDTNSIYPILCMYDTSHSYAFMDYLKRYYPSIEIRKCDQTAVKLSEPLKAYKSELADKTIVFDNDITTWCHMNTHFKMNNDGYIKPSKSTNKSKKIDALASQLDAYAGYLNFYKTLEANNFYDNKDKSLIDN